MLDPLAGLIGDVQRMRPVPWPRPWAPHKGEGDPRPEIEPVLTLDTGTKDGLAKYLSVNHAAVTFMDWRREELPGGG